MESFRVLRTNLQFLDVDQTSKTYAITSPMPGDGKTTTSINIALALAESGSRTILIETDLRRPKFGEYLNLESTVGLTTVLIGGAQLSDAIQPWGRTGLDVIASGVLPPNPAELLQSKAMAAVLEQLRRDYDAVVIDAPPILPVTDAALIAAQTGGAILVVRHGKTTRDQAAQARQRLTPSAPRCWAPSSTSCHSGPARPTATGTATDTGTRQPRRCPPRSACRVSPATR